MTDMQLAERRRVESAIRTGNLDEVEWHTRNLVHLVLREELRRTDIGTQARTYLALERVRETLLPLLRTARKGLRVRA